MATLASVPLPKLIETVRRGYSIHAFLSDLVAGVTVGLVALPLAMAFAIASGVPPQNGLYCAVVAGFIISALGSSGALHGQRARKGVFTTTSNFSKGARDYVAPIDPRIVVVVP